MDDLMKKNRELREQVRQAGQLFAAQYLFQEVFCYKAYSEEGFLRQQLLPYDLYFLDEPEHYLLLRPIYKMEAHVEAELKAADPTVYNAKDMAAFIYQTPQPGGLDRVGSINRVLRWQNILRSHGYALPYYCPVLQKWISVDEQVALGWVKLV